MPEPSYLLRKNPYFPFIKNEEQMQVCFYALCEILNSILPLVEKALLILQGQAVCLWHLPNTYIHRKKNESQTAPLSEK